ncbi:hypothetical protein BDY24DRAFT_398770 [Mrakia frigida]|uniref:uncharacterized protein n=1 Tax=Mrakia frigida TaxID=29902 RepID=UPI003FCBF87E
MASTRVAWLFDKIQAVVVFGCVGLAVTTTFGMTQIHKERMELSEAYKKKLAEQEARMETPERKAKRLLRESKALARKTARDIENGIAPPGTVPAHLISEN